MNLKALISMIRPGNSIMAAIGISIGFLFSGETNILSLLFLIIAGSSALGFGNVINDIFDIETDKIAHPERALPSKKVTIRQAWLFTIILAALAIGAGFAVSTRHGTATLIPIIVLFFYAVKLKATPLAGNLIVSALVAYTLIFGALNGDVELLILPAFLAFLTNLIREIVKDLSDEEGDKSAGIITTASLPRALINRLIFTLILFSIVLAPLPLIYSSFRMIYPVGIFLILFPLQLMGLKEFKTVDMPRFSSNLKKQLLTGLLLIAAEGIRFLITSP